MKITRILGAAAILLTACFLLAPSVKAQSTNPIPNLNYNIVISNLNLLPITAGENLLDLNLNVGSGNVTNTVTLSNFVFTGGSVDGANTNNFTNGNTTGSTASSIVLTGGNAGVDNEFEQAFTTSVTKISFNVSITPFDEIVGTGTPAPDLFFFNFQNGGGTNITTTDTGDAPNYTFVNETIASTNTTASVNFYQGTGAAAGVTASVSPVPEPSTYALFGLGALLLVNAVRRRVS